MASGKDSRRRTALALRALTSAAQVVYRLGAGRLLGHRFLMLEFRRAARRQGRVLEVVSWDAEREEAVVIALLGTEAPWYRAALDGRVEELRIAGRRLRPRARQVEGEEAFRLFSEFEKRNRLLLPLARPVISRLAGFRYDGSAAARHRLLGQMPLIGLRPAGDDG